MSEASRHPPVAEEPSRPPLEILDDVTSDRLRRAAVRVAEEWWDRPETNPREAPAFLRRLSTLALQIETLQSGGAPLLDPESIRRPYVYFRLNEALRRHLLSGWAEEEGAAAGAADTLGLLQAMERVPGLIWPERDGDPIARLVEPDALELVVEMAHDIHSPLNSILFLSETLRAGHSGPVNEVQASQLGLMYSAGLRIMAMAGDVMELAKQRRLPAADPPSPFSIQDLFGMVHEMVRPMAEEKGLDLEFRHSGSNTFLGHSVPLGRVLLNLTTNALKFTEEGRVLVSATWTGPSEIEFSVQDTGRGIRPEMQHLLFEPFQEAHGREGHFFSVSGLGLQIARRLVERMGSELQFETEEGEGTRFFFRLRLPSPDASVTSPRSPTVPQ